MSIGVSRINYNSPLGSYADLFLWEVNDSQQGFNNVDRVYPAYYAMVFAADFIGTSGNTRVAELSLPGQDPVTAEVVAYGAYDDGKLARLAAIGYSAADGISTPLSFDLGSDSGVKEVELRKLINYTPPPSNFIDIYSNDHRAEVWTPNITWGGLTWNANTQGLGVQAADDTVTKSVTNGIVEFELTNNEAVMAFLKY